MKSKVIRRYLIAGLVVWLPIVATLVVLRFLIDILDQSLSLLPQGLQPKQLFGVDIPGLGIILSLVILFSTGLFATNFFGAKLVAWGEMILARIPLVRSIYHAVKQVMETIFSSSSQAFRKVLLVEYPRKGLWSIAFQTSKAYSEIDHHTEDEMITIFIPTTPNPTSGFLMMVSVKEAIELKMTVDEALKMVISLGVMQPGSQSVGLASHLARE